MHTGYHDPQFLLPRCMQQADKPSTCRWIILWKNGTDFAYLSRQACEEAQGRAADAAFRGKCSAHYSSVITGLAISVRNAVCRQHQVT